MPNLSELNTLPVPEQPGLKRKVRARARVKSKNNSVLDVSGDQLDDSRGINDSPNNNQLESEKLMN